VAPWYRCCRSRVYCRLNSRWVRWMGDDGGDVDIDEPCSYPIEPIAWFTQMSASSLSRRKEWLARPQEAVGRDSAVLHFTQAHALSSE
jgi:hypothetical protein